MGRQSGIDQKIFSIFLIILGGQVYSIVEEAKSILALKVYVVSHFNLELPIDETIAPVVGYSSLNE